MMWVWYSKAQAIRALKRNGYNPADYTFVKEDGLTFAVAK